MKRASISPLLGRVLRHRRQELALTLEEVSARMAWVQGKSEVSEIERGVRNPQWSSVEKLITALEWSLVEVGIAMQIMQSRSAAPVPSPDPYQPSSRSVWETT